MKIQHLEWDENNIDHIARHGVDPDEVEEALVDKPLIRRGRQGRYLIYGQTTAGRYLFAVVKPLRSAWARVITARDMTDRERRYYRRRGK